MDLSLSAEQQQIQQLFRELAKKEIRPQAAEIDAQAVFPRALFEKVGEVGLFGMRYPPPEGSGADLLSFLLALEELAWGSLSVAAVCAMQALMGTFFVQRFAEGELRERLLAPALRGDLVGTICMTEPGAGSDLGAIATRAEEDSGVWRLTGQKTWITSAPVADFFTVFARTGEKELSVFLLEKGAPGLSVGRSIEKMGVRGSPTSEVFFDHTPATCLLGERGKGMGYLKQVLVPIRLLTAALALGTARAAFEEAREYAAERTQFGRAIARFQAIQKHLAAMAIDLEAARRLTYWAAWRAEQGQPAVTEAAMAKLFSSEAALRICDRACRVLASYGFARDHAVERYLRDVRFTLIGGGTSEILEINIAKGVMR